MTAQQKQCYTLAYNNHTFILYADPGRYSQNVGGRQGRNSRVLGVATPTL